MAERVGRSRRKWHNQELPNDGVILLNTDYTFLHVVKWKNAIKLMEKGKVEVLKLGTKVVRNYERTRVIVVPLIMRLIKMIRTLYNFLNTKFELVKEPSMVELQMIDKVEEMLNINDK